MLKEIHDHIVSELQQNAKTDTVFVVSAVLFNLIVLGINWGVAFEAARALFAGRTSREKLLLGLKKMYRDNDVAQYYDDDLLGTYRARALFHAGFVPVSGSRATSAK